MEILEIVIQEIKNLDYQIQEIDNSIDLLQKADEAFLTNSTQFLVPISSLNKKIIGSGQAGKYSCELYEKYNILWNNCHRFYFTNRL